MGIAGSWAAGAQAPAEYPGAAKWGTGINPVHAMPDAHPTWTTKIPLGSVDDDATMPESILGPAQWGYSTEEAALYPGEDYRYLNDHDNWGAASAGRPDRSDESLPGEAPFPPWGPHEDDNPVDGFPIGGPTGGADIRAFSQGAEIENTRAIAVPTPGVSGGWLNKAHGDVLDARTSDPAQYEVTTSMRQLHESRVNDSATLRGTDDARTAVATRLTGIKVKHYGLSEGMGGGPGTPDMAVLSQDLPFRPWYFRQGAAPPMEDHTWNEVTYFDPILRSLPPDAGEQVTQPESPADDGMFGYSGGDYFA